MHNEDIEVGSIFHGEPQLMLSQFREYLERNGFDTSL